MDNTITWTKQQAGIYTAAFLNDAYTAIRVGGQWQLRITNPDAPAGFDWCNTYYSFGNLKDECEAALQG